MLTLGIHDGHTATACLLENGEVIACISEERLNRIKEWDGFPEAAIKKCLEISGKQHDEVEAIGICSLMPQIGTESWFKPNFYKRSFSYFAKVLPKSFLQSSANIQWIQKIGQAVFRSRNKHIIAQLSKMGFKTKNIFFFEHHLLHAATAYFGNWYKNI